MARLTLILSVLTALVALLGGFRYVVDTLREYRWRKRQTGKWLLLCGLLLLPVPAYAVFDASDYRQNTYGVPDHYCDLTLSIAAPSGTGTLGDPWNATRCMSEPAAGDVVGILPVGAGTPADLPSRKGTGDEAVPAFNPANSGTAGNPIVYVTKYAAVALDRATITTNQNRSEIRHDGTADAADVQGTGGAAFGATSVNYIVMDGFFVDMAQAHFSEDSGVITIRNSTGSKLTNFVIKGEVTDCDSNCEIYRSNADTDSTLSNFVVYDYDNQPTGGGLNQEGFVVVMYGAANYLIENFHLDTVDNGIFPKGTSPSNVGYNYGTIRYGIINDVKQCARFNDFHASNLTTMHHVLCRDYTESGIVLSAETSSSRNFLLHHVTAANSATNAAHGPVYIKNTTAVDVTIRDNIFDYTGSITRGVDAGEDTNTFPTTNYNGYYNNGSTVVWSYNGSDYNTIAGWRTATSQEANSQVLASSPFTNRAADDYTLTGGHAALTASSTGGEIGAYEGDHTIGVDTSGGTSSSVVMFIEYLGMLLAGLSHVCTAGYLVMRKRTVLLSILIFPYVVGRWVYLKCRFMQYLYAVGRWQRQAPRMLAPPTMVAPMTQAGNGSTCQI